MARSWQPRLKSKTASIQESVSMVAEFGQQQWSCTNFWCSDRTLRSRDRIVDFSQEMVKICAGAENRTPTEILIGRAATTSRYSTGETSPIKAERPGPSDHLRSTCLRINTIYDDLNESSSARLGGSSWRFCRAQIVRGHQTFPLKFWIGAEILPGTEIFIGAEISTSAIVLSYAWILPGA